MPEINLIMLQLLSSFSPKSMHNSDHHYLHHCHFFGKSSSIGIANSFLEYFVIANTFKAYFGIADTFGEYFGTANT